MPTSTRWHHHATALVLQLALIVATVSSGTPVNGAYIAIMQDPTSAAEQAALEGPAKYIEVELDPYVEHVVYVVVWSVDSPLCVSSWEGSLCGWAVNDPNFHISSVTLLPQGMAINLASAPDFEVGRGTELQLAVGQVGVLAEVRFMFVMGFEAGRIAFTGTPCNAIAKAHGCGATRGFTSRSMLIKNAQKYDSTPYATERELATVEPDSNPLRLPREYLDVVAGIGSVVDVNPFVENAISDNDLALVTIDVTEYWRGGGDPQLVLSSYAIINHAWGSNAYWPGKDGGLYLTPGDNLIFVASRLAERARRVHWEQNMVYHLTFARYLLGAPDDHLQETFEQSQADYDYPVDPSLLRGPVDLQRLQRVFVPSGQSVTQVRDEITRFYLTTEQ